ncbi:putative alcohol dehydrogenase [Rosellinia necatrix]|uniref:Putative alcohol dehydrogenase n=1 Tax=Rosellinia necatrix TaxID=77044 RepID=A0A1W2TLV0_ROSNE|nr:putative alcohol dehydrogenase [Rosellinia necatrix]
MKAGQWDAKNQKVVINDVPIPELKKDMFLVKIKSASLCHSDLMGLARDHGATVTMGHEGSGVIEKIHPSAEGKGFKVGDAVGFNYFINVCYECDGCQIHNQRCENTDLPTCQGFHTDGFFQEYVLVDYHTAVVLPPEIDVRRASPLFCAGITAFNAIDSCELQPGQWIAIVGCGGLGQYAVQYAKAMGYQVVGVDVSDESLASAREYGADHVFNSATAAETYVEAIRGLSGKGVHAAAVFSGANAAFDGAVPLLRTNGLLMVVGIAPRPLQVNSIDLITGRYRIKADSTGVPQRMPKAVAFTAKHNIQPNVDFRKIEDLPDMVADMRNGKARRRQVVTFD